MASSGKKRTTMAKLNRETRLRTKRAEKEARRAARKLSAGDAMEASSGAHLSRVPVEGDLAQRP